MSVLSNFRPVPHYLPFSSRDSGCLVERLRIFQTMTTIRKTKSIDASRICHSSRREGWIGSKLIEALSCTTVLYGSIHSFEVGFGPPSNHSRSSIGIPVRIRDRFCQPNGVAPKHEFRIPRRVGPPSQPPYFRRRSNGCCERVEVVRAYSPFLLGERPDLSV